MKTSTLSELYCRVAGGSDIDTEILRLCVADYRPDKTARTEAYQGFL